MGVQRPRPYWETEKFEALLRPTGSLSVAGGKTVRINSRASSCSLSLVSIGVSIDRLREDIWSDFHRDGPAACNSFSHTRPRHRRPSRSRPLRSERDQSDPPEGLSPIRKTFVLCQVEPAGRLGRARSQVSIACFAEPLLQERPRVWPRKSAPVSMPSACILAAVFGPTPWNFAIGSVATKASARPAGSRTGHLACDSSMRSSQEIVAGNSGRGCKSPISS